MSGKCAKCTQCNICVRYGYDEYYQRWNNFNQYRSPYMINRPIFQTSSGPKRYGPNRKP